VTGIWLGNDDNSPTRKATGGGLPVEVWTRFMKAAHQGVTPMPLPNSQPVGLFTNMVQASSQLASPPAPMPMSTTGVAGRPGATRTSVRPEAAAGLDGWLMERLFGR
jgi:penicillin-binding protein 1A